MRKADVVLAVLVAVALAATAVAAWRGDSWAGERTLQFSSHAEPLATLGPSAATGAGASFNWTVPDNATAANLTIQVTFAGQGVRGGFATVSVRITMPDGRDAAPVTKAMPIAQGGTSGSLALGENVTWSQAPRALRDTTTVGHGLHWQEPLRVTVTVEPPAGDVPLARYGFTATVSGSTTVYALVL